MDREEERQGKAERKATKENKNEWEKEVDGHKKEFPLDQLQRLAMKNYFSTWPSCSPPQSLPPGWPHPLLSHSLIMSVGSS